MFPLNIVTHKNNRRKLKNEFKNSHAIWKGTFSYKLYKRISEFYISDRWYWSICFLTFVFNSRLFFLFIIQDKGDHHSHPKTGILLKEISVIHHTLIVSVPDVFFQNKFFIDFFDILKFFSVFWLYLTSGNILPIKFSVLNIFILQIKMKEFFCSKNYSSCLLEGTYI